jgi:hypothetical protein
MKADKIHNQIDKLIEKIQGVDFKFQDESMQSDFDEIKNDAASLLEELNDMISAEVENSNEEGDE